MLECGVMWRACWRGHKKGYQSKLGIFLQGVILISQKKLQFESLLKSVFAGHEHSVFSHHHKSSSAIQYNRPLIENGYLCHHTHRIGLFNDVCHQNQTVVDEKSKVGLTILSTVLLLDAVLPKSHRT